MLIKILFIPSKKVYQHLHFVGNMKVDVKNSNQFIMRHYGFELENEIFWKGIYNGWEKVSIGIWAELCSSSNTIIDIGANTGVYSLLAKTIQPKSQIFAFEPVERVYKKLILNNRLNNYDIVCEKKAISNYTGKAIIYDKNTEHIYSVTVNKDISSDKINSIATEIDTITLDDYIEENQIKKIDLLKIDVETHEAEVLEGFQKYLKLFTPTFLIEILNDEVAQNVEKIISNMGYVYYVIDENSGIKKVDSLRTSDYYNFLIATPERVKEMNSIKKFTALYENR